jgi:oxygen-independent coproporphyrinogen-3 oxidase
LYSLTIEKGTPLYKKVNSGLLPEVDQDIAADMYELATEMLERNEFIQYEISNWARNDENGRLFSCKHNMQYWRTMPYIGIGAGAHGFINSHRTVNTPTPIKYVQNLNTYDNKLENHKLFPWTPATEEIIKIDRETEIGEFMMMGLRLINEGVSNIEFHRRFGINLQDMYQAKIERLIKLQLLEWAGSSVERLRLSKKGRLLGNLVFSEFI